MPAFPVPRFTHEEFLEREALSPFRHEFRRGRVEMMAGGTHHHSLVGANVIARMSALLADRDCEVHGGELLVYVAQAELSTHPDVLVICGAPRFCDRKRREVENPLVLFEVLSPSTEAYDRGEKFEAYKQLPSLREHVLLSPDRPRAERSCATRAGAALRMRAATLWLRSRASAWDWTWHLCIAGWSSRLLKRFK